MMTKNLFLSLFGLTLFAIANAEAQDKTAPKLTPASINTDKDEDDPHYVPTASGILPPRLYFSRKNEKGKYCIMVSKWNKKGNKWADAETIGAYVDSEGDDRSCFLTDEGKFPQLIIFSTKKDQKNNNFDLYRSYRDAPGKDLEDKAFNPGRPLLGLDSESDEMHPWLTKDMQTLFFSRKSKEGMTLFQAKKVKDTGNEGNFVNPEPVKNITVGYHHATLNPLGTLMFLEGPMENDRSGIFFSQKNATGWSNPLPVSNLNDSKGKIGDKSPCLSRDGIRLYFSSDRPGGQGGLDIYSVAVSDLKLK
ncbi:MAG: hypothetical protein ACO3E9_03760 [Gemmataceae bacterium]